MNDNAPQGYVSPTSSSTGNGESGKRMPSLELGVPRLEDMVRRVHLDRESEREVNETLAEYTHRMHAISETKSSFTHQPTINISQLLQLEQICCVFGILKDVGRRTVDGYPPRCPLPQSKDDGWIRVVTPMESNSIKSLWFLPMKAMVANEMRDCAGVGQGFAKAIIMRVHTFSSLMMEERMR